MYAKNLTDQYFSRDIQYSEYESLVKEMMAVRDNRALVLFGDDYKESFKKGMGKKRLFVFNQAYVQ